MTTDAQIAAEKHKKHEKQGHAGPPKDYNSLVIRSKNIEMPDEEFKNLALKMSSNFKENTNKQTDGVKKSVQDLHKKLGNVDEKFRREVEVLKQ